MNDTCTHGWHRKDTRSEFGGTGKLRRTPLQEDYGAGDKDGSKWEGLLPRKEQEKKRERDD